MLSRDEMERRHLSREDKEQTSKRSREMGQLRWWDKCGGRVEERSEKWDCDREHLQLLSELFDEAREV